jgi:hypothetical protein
MLFVNVSSESLNTTHMIGPHSHRYIQPLSSPSSGRSMTSLNLRGGGVFSPELSSVIGGGATKASTAMLSRDGLFARQELLVPVSLLGGLKVVLSLSKSALAFEAALAADTLWIGRTSVAVILGDFSLFA